ncbi:MAG: hypothetical protein WBW85_15220 [Terriglobales bacterium]
MNPRTKARRPSLRLVAMSVASLILLMAAIPAFGQGCALCYTQAAASGARMIAALRSGILILVIPPMFLSVGVIVLAYKRRNQFRGCGLDKSVYLTHRTSLPVPRQHATGQRSRLIGDVR